MNTDHIVCEVRNARREIFESHGNDPDKLFEEVMTRQIREGRPLLGRNPLTGMLEEVPAKALEASAPI